MKRYFIIAALMTAVIGFSAQAQDESENKHHDIQTVFRGGSVRSGGYGAITNKFTTINGQFANMVEVYGGWYINRRFMFGIGAGAVTNNIPVPVEHRANPTEDLSYEYGQVGLVTEYVVASNKPVHLVFHLFTGAGFTLQYNRYNWDDDYSYRNYPYDENWFFVMEPGVQVEINLLRWMRFSPGVSYRAAFGSEAYGLTDADLSGGSVDLTLKFGRF